MKSKNNEQGYVLLLTLVMIFILILFTSTFFFASSNQMTQVKSTGETIVATSHAEMGVEYYHKLLNRYVEDTKTAIAAATSNVNDEDELKEILNDQLDEFTAKVTNLQTKVKVQEQLSSNSYGITRFRLLENADHYLLTLDVTGNTEGNYQTIKVDYKFSNSLAEIVVKETGSGASPGSGSGSTPPTFIPSNAIPDFPSYDASSIAACSTSYQNVQCKVNDYSGEMSQIKNSTIYSNTFRVSNNNLVQNATIYASGTITGQNINKGFSNVRLFTKGSIQSFPSFTPNGLYMHALGNVSLSGFNSTQASNLEPAEIYSNQNLSFSSNIDAANLKLGASTITLKNINNNASNFQANATNSLNVDDINASNAVLRGSSVSIGTLNSSSNNLAVFADQQLTINTINAGNQSLYSNGNIQINTNLNSSSNNALKLVAAKDLIINAISAPTNFELEANNIHFKKTVNSITDSTIVAFGSLRIDNTNEIRVYNSYMYVNELSFPEPTKKNDNVLKVYNGSKLCIRSIDRALYGHLDTASGEIHILGPTPAPSEITGNGKMFFYSNAAAFEKECSVPSSDLPAPVPAEPGFNLSINQETPILLDDIEYK